MNTTRKTSLKAKRLVAATSDAYRAELLGFELDDEDEDDLGLRVVRSRMDHPDHAARLGLALATMDVTAADRVRGNLNRCTRRETIFLRAAGFGEGR
jgi:hypothetical protein